MALDTVLDRDRRLCPLLPPAVRSSLFRPFSLICSRDVPDISPPTRIRCPVYERLAGKTRRIVRIGTVHVAMTRGGEREKGRQMYATYRYTPKSDRSIRSTSATEPHLPANPCDNIDGSIATLPTLTCIVNREYRSIFSLPPPRSVSSSSGNHNLPQC